MLPHGQLFYDKIKNKKGGIDEEKRLLLKKDKKSIAGMKLQGGE